MINILKVIYNKIWIWRYNRNVNYWYNRDKCPVCHEPIEWEEEGGELGGAGQPYPVHKDLDQDEKCEGVN